MTEKNKRGFVYAAVNPLFNQFIKIGMTEDLKKRFRSLNSNVPKSYRCAYAIEVADNGHVERLLHETFAWTREKGKEFFTVSEESVIAAMKLTNGKRATLEDDDSQVADEINKNAEETEKANNRLTFADIGVVDGDELEYVRVNGFKARVIDNEKNKIKFEKEIHTLTSAAKILIKREEDLKWKQVNGWTYWMKDGISMQTLARRFERGEIYADSLF